MSEYLLCCFYLNKHSTSRSPNGKISLRHIDKSMIGLPTNFKHCAHIGYADVADTCSSNSPTSCASSQSNQMSTNGNLIKKNNSIKYPASHDYNPHFLGPRSMTSNQPVNHHQYNHHHDSSLVSHLKLIDLKIAWRASLTTTGQQTDRQTDRTWKNQQPTIRQIQPLLLTKKKCVNSKATTNNQPRLNLASNNYIHHQQLEKKHYLSTFFTLLNSCKFNSVYLYCGEILLFFFYIILSS